MSVSTPTLATVGLTSRMIASEVKPLSAKEFWPLARRIDLGSLGGRDVQSLAADGGLSVGDAERVLRLLDRATALALSMEQMEQAGIWTMTPDQESYPAHLCERLADAAPPLLHGVGPMQLLATPGLGIVGSRDVTPEGAEVARQAARVAVEAGWPVTSGAARGVDQQAMAAAFEADGHVVGVLADSLTRTIRGGDIRRAVLEERTTLITPYAPDAGFSAGNAMGRNKIIYGLSRRVFVVCSDKETGGTWAGAIEALRAGWVDVAVWRGEGEGPGNAALVRRGGVETTDEATLVSAESTPHASAEHADQLALDV